MASQLVLPCECRCLGFGALGFAFVGFGGRRVPSRRRVVGFFRLLLSRSLFSPVFLCMYVALAFISLVASILLILSALSDFVSVDCFRCFRHYFRSSEKCPAVCSWLFLIRVSRSVRKAEEAEEVEEEGGGGTLLFWLQCTGAVSFVGFTFLFCRVSILCKFAQIAALCSCYIAIRLVFARSFRNVFCAT
jgi:hypothetical protein